MSSFVFIHGLNGGAIKTWTADNVFWPKDLLPAEIPHARVLAFGYDAQVVHFWSEPSQNRIDNHADALFAELSGVRDRTQTVSSEDAIYAQLHSVTMFRMSDL